MSFPFPLDLKYTLHITLGFRRAQVVNVEVQEKGNQRFMQQNSEPFPAEVQLVCTLTQSERVTRGEELDDIFKHVQQVNELADGYALCFPGSDDWANRLMQFITFERRCCPFFTFALVFELKQGPIWLHLRGPAGVKPIIENMIRPQERSISQ
jgi:hypothetical protein